MMLFECYDNTKLVNILEIFIQDASHPLVGVSQRNLCLSLDFV